MKKKSKHSMLLFFTAVLGLVLIIRLFMLTVIEHGKWQEYADAASQRAVYETAPRGDILDRKGRILAGSKAVYSVNLSRMNLNKESVLESAAGVMNILKETGEDVSVTQEEIKEQLETGGYESYLPVVIAENVSQSTAEIIVKEQYPGVEISTDFIRNYPNGSLASHILGYVGRISEEETKEYIDEKGYRTDAVIGKAGIEQVCEQQLRGTDAVSKLLIDSSGKVNDILGRSDAKKGKDVKLTIDLELQKVTEEALENAIEQASLGGVFESSYGDCSMIYAKNAAAGAAVAIDIDTGQVLSMASFPDYDPNVFTGNMTQEEWEKLQGDANDPVSPAPLYNVATMTAVQPGSAFKPVTALAALNCGLDPNMKLYDAGFIPLGGRTYGCSLWNDRGKTHGYTDMTDALAASCNYYFYDIAAGKDFAEGKPLNYEKKIDHNIIASYAKALGLGEKTGIEIGESSGTLPSSELKASSVKNGLKNFLIAECETYFTSSALENTDSLLKKAEKISNWADKDLTLDEIIGKLKDVHGINKNKLEELAEICLYDYYSRSRWSMGDTFNISIGQGDNAYTALQMAYYMSVLGNNGNKTGVSLIMKDGKTRDTSENKEQYSEPKLNHRDIKTVISGLTAVTKGDNGTLCGIFDEFPYEVAAKTGTAQRAGSISRLEEREYLRRHLHLIAPGVLFEAVEAEAERLMKKFPEFYETEAAALRRAVINLSKNNITTEDIDRYKEKYDAFAWTVAMAPADEPEIAVAVMLIQGKSSLNAAPVVREIIGKYGEINRWERLF